jgi:multiphosphoryl transfer protein
MADVGLVVVSHSRALATAAIALAGEMLHERQVRIAVAAGLDESTFGTDATQIVEAITGADRGDGVVVLMDLGSAVLSAELALELLDPEVRGRVALCPAPMVEGLVVAAVAAAGGAGMAEVAAEAASALDGKTAQLAPPAGTSGPAPADDAPGAEEITGAFTLTNAHGLHARPAARLVQTLVGLDARARLRNRTTGSAWVPASSLSKIATLGALPGHDIEVRASGGQAREALDGLLALAARNFDDPPDTPAAATAATAPPSPEPAAPADTHRPLAASPGIGIGPARTGHVEPIDIPDTPAGDPETEWAQLIEAITTARREITELRARTARDLGESDAAIFDAHLLLLDDPDLLDQVRSHIDSGQAAAHAWARAVDALRAQLAALPDPYQQARAADVAAVGDQVLRALLATPTTQPNTPAGVLVAASLTPADAAGLDPETVAAVLLAFDTPTAHAAILLRARGIPAVVAAGAGVLDIAEGTPLVVDGGRGRFEVDPPPETLHAYQKQAEQLAAFAERALADAAAPARTQDGVEIAVGANIGSVDDAHTAARLGADLAGLVRTEFLFLGRSQPPDIDEQETIYRDIAAALGGRRITLRTLDVGGDKPLPYLPTPTEANPYLGVRGIRLSLAHPQLFTDQLLAIARVARHTPVSVMFPMVATLDELLTARRLLDEAIAHTGPNRPTGLHVGVMIEIPAAALNAAALAPHVDFLSIGTNDLTQYALAADRNNDAVAALANPYHPGVLRLIQATCQAAHATNGRVTVAVCGEIAADKPAATLLTGLGVRELSVTPPAIPATKQAIRALNTHHAAELARTALAAPEARPRG